MNVILHLIAAWFLFNALVVVLLTRREDEAGGDANQLVSRQRTASVSGDPRKQA